MKTLLIVPRFHPNQYILSEEIAKKNEFEVWALYKFDQDYYKYIKLVERGYSVIFKIINQVFGRKVERKTKTNFELKYAFPPLIKFIFDFISYKPELVIVKNIENVYSLLALSLARLFGKKALVILSIKKYRKQEPSKAVEWIGKIFKAKVITPLKGRVKDQNTNDNLYFLPFPLPRTEERKEYFKDNKVNIVCVGKYQERKDQLLLLKALKELKTETLVINFIGQTDEGDYLEILKNFVNENDLDDKVNFYFDLSWEEVQEKYRANDLFVLPAYSELHSVAAIEAMSNGLMAVVTDKNGIQDYVAEGESGFVIKKGDLEGLIRIIKVLANNKEKIIRMGNRAQADILAKCDQVNFYNKFKQILDA